MLVAVVDDDRARADMLMRMVRDSPVWAEYHGEGYVLRGNATSDALDPLGNSSGSVMWKRVRSMS